MKFKLQCEGGRFTEIVTTVVMSSTFQGPLMGWKVVQVCTETSALRQLKSAVRLVEHTSN
jgi:hypothetical protein